MAVKKSKQLNFRILDKDFSLEINTEIENFFQSEIQSFYNKLTELKTNFPNDNNEVHLIMYLLWRAGKYSEEQLFIKEQLDKYKAQLSNWQEQIADGHSGLSEEIPQKINSKLEELD